ncbi:TPA: glycerophosphodiester phosphodiesterase [Pseudomonas aeruginosa]|nr:glycerophosphodiester phosphodiesterase [Pseudomonas aeruginosa]HCF7733169.1 glycerophosphodiester phosphodiesterase [Pseudomonas aeruginosa]HCK0541298.1 glycerophosphodiester phosphodiesterase [Pseudomonas aeruginosa]HEE6747508.1 glycerophosphodiester phosphodiesterase [Pseudomonas aeruginosa]HEE6759899.1 glycerophosphodiester phosphodiesterase [Pseudomonas aeruginosa]
MGLFINFKVEYMCIGAARSLSVLIFSLFISACSEEEKSSLSSTLSGQAVTIVAHRGASGERPEHTLGSYELAIELGADFIEPDLVLTKDGVLVVRHENEISQTTNVEDHPEFFDRKTTKLIDGKKVTGWFTEDFTLAELKTLRARERIPQLRSTDYDDRYQILTFEEVLELLTKVNAGRKHPIGVYPETKHPTYFSSIGLSHEAPLLDLLSKFGYQGKDAPIFIQSFEVENLKALHAKTDVPLIQLMDESGGPFDDPNTTYAEMATLSGLKLIRSYADGIAPNKYMVIPRDIFSNLKDSNGLVEDAHRLGLKVHVWTFRRENYFLPLRDKSGFNFAGHGDISSEVKSYLDAGIDGLFTDNPREVVMFMRGK